MIDVSQLPAVRAQLERDAAALRGQRSHACDGAATAGVAKAARAQSGKSVEPMPGRLYVGMSRSRVHRPA